jgi:uncharacterized membrane protein required for colicin V production
MVSNFLDITYIAIVCLSTAAGLYSGAVKLIISFIFLILSFIFAYLIFVPVTDIMHEYVSSNFMVHVASAAVSYLLCAISCAIIASKLKALVVDISGGATDRFIGLLLGGARGVAVSFIIFVAVTIFTTKSYETAKNVFELVVTLLVRMVSRRFCCQSVKCVCLSQNIRIRSERWKTKIVVYNTNALITT